MTDLERRIYADMAGIDRILLYLKKCEDLIEFYKIMTEEDIKLLAGFVELVQHTDEEPPKEDEHAKT